MKLRIGSYNIHNGYDVGHDFSVLAQDVVDFGLDICGFQEVDLMASRSKNQNSMAIMSKESGYPYYAFIRALDFGKGGQYGTGILSKYPILRYEVIPLVSDDYEPRSCGHAVIDVNGEIVHFFNTHVSYENKEIRTRQLEQLMPILAENDHYILTADFNTADFSELTVLPDAHLVSDEASPLLSFAKKSPIDNIIFTSKYTLVEKGISQRTSHSDHTMIWADLEAK